ncbi:PEP-dependent dihydroxyacetone kinase, ADP-binding subunit DhaL [Baekduia alba]|uniref:dihydroxyacetone kinase subunit DhaL n=1 Tax=Baekduia alba TaxID=2997333 RepID=UPI0032C47D7E|nr:PEP-dependent dihydroxyacetone kinase, ADP-binding subunit DhaL [Baekduia alba]
MSSVTAVVPQTVVAWLSGLAEDVAAQADHLTQLDAAIGDGDHGINMNRGMSAVVATLGEQDDDVAPGRLLIVAGKTLVSTVGGASGPLWGSFFRGAGRALGDAPELEGPELAEALAAGVKAVQDLGAAVPGDKTMVDALLPAVEALREALAGGASLADAARSAADAAAEGARGTVPLQARKGRASYLGERSVGHEDPGAASTVLVMTALARAVG